QQENNQRVEMIAESQYKMLDNYIGILDNSNILIHYVSVILLWWYIHSAQQPLLRFFFAWRQTEHPGFPG
ncbi:MAG: hypothetical protein JAY85_09015, partial [Candidatus Thiodiazotropha weberae]|nr:hypothetical protein [Candidatus Thiodiazotropha weberae]